MSSAATPARSLSDASKEALKVLLVEDNAADAELILRALQRDGGFAAGSKVVCTPEEFRAQLKAAPPDAVLADYDLGSWLGMETLEILREEEMEIPLILVSGTVGEMRAVDCIKEGATDYVLKDRLVSLPAVVRRALLEKSLRERQKNAEAALLQQQSAVDQHAIVATTDAHGIITYVNDKFCAISKYSREELLGQTHRIVNSGYHSQEFFQQMYNTITSGRVWNGDIRNRAKDGSIYWVASTIVPFVDSRGKPTQYMAIRTDITANKRAEEAREHLASIVDSSDDAIISKDANGTINAWNRGAIKIFGYSASEAVGQPVQMLIPPDRADEETDIMARIRRGESVEHYETIRVRKDSKSIDVSVTISPIKDSVGKIVGASKIARDITARKVNEKRLAVQARELARKIDELARSNADLEQFAYVASHDLQEPLRMVAAYTQLLAERYKGKLDENADKFIGYASEGAHRMQVLILDLLAFSRVGRAEAKYSSVDCNAVVEGLKQDLGSAIAESGAVLAHADLPVIRADRLQLTQVLQNLTANAIKFRGNQKPEIFVGAEQAGENWQFSVKDNGIGIAPEFVENIFVVFQRLHTRTEYPGNGIGLAICKKIVDRNGGKIWVESQPGSGSTFKFTLPVKPHEGNGGPA